MTEPSNDNPQSSGAVLTMQRLAFIRFLYSVALERSRAPGPAAAYASILEFHDAVELFLNLAYSRLGESKKDPGFMEYWDYIDPKLKPDRLGQKEAMRRLNNVRGALKHHGVFPAPIEIETARVGTTVFFEENTPLVFKRPFVFDLPRGACGTPSNTRVSQKGGICTLCWRPFTGPDRRCVCVRIATRQ